MFGSYYYYYINVTLYSPQDELYFGSEVVGCTLIFRVPGSNNVYEPYTEQPSYNVVPRTKCILHMNSLVNASVCAV